MVSQTLSSRFQFCDEVEETRRRKEKKRARGCERT